MGRSREHWAAHDRTVGTETKTSKLRRKGTMTFKEGYAP